MDVRVDVDVDEGERACWCKCRLRRDCVCIYMRMCRNRYTDCLYTVKGKNHDVYYQSDPPFVIVNTNESNPSQEDFKGFSVDIVRELAKKMDFEYKFVVLEKGGSGSKKDGKWNGLVGALINKVSYTT